MFKKEDGLNFSFFLDVVAGIDGTRELDYLEEMINKQKPFIQVLRLLCLMSVAQGGLKSRVYDHFEREIAQVRRVHTRQFGTDASFFLFLE